MTTKRIIIAALALLLIFTGCTKNTGKDGENSSKTPESETESKNSEPTVAKSAKSVIDEEIAPLQKDMYPELQITAAILERKAILQGDIFRVNIVVTNSGSQDITFSNGHANYAVPAALKIYVDGMQVIPQPDRLGPDTPGISDKTIKAGETLTFDYFVTAIKESDEFLQIATQQYVEEQKYIGDMTTEEFLKAYPNQVASEKGGYTGQVFFTYLVKQDGADTVTSYAQAEFGLTVS